MSKKALVWISIIAGVVLLIAAAAGAGFFILQRQQEKAKTEGMAPKFPAAPLPVMTANLKTSDLDRTIETGETLPLVGKVVSSSPIVRLELWINGKKVDERVPVDGWEKTDFTVLWSWKPPAAGEYDLITRGIDAKGISNYSNLVTIIVDEAPVDANGQKILPTPDAAKSTPVADIVFAPASPINFAEQAQPGDIDPGAENAKKGEMGEVSSPNNPPPSPAPDGPDENDPIYEINVIPSAGEDCTHRLKISTDNPDITFYYIYVKPPEGSSGFSASGFMENDQKQVPNQTGQGFEYTEYIDKQPKVTGTYQYYVSGIKANKEETSSEIVEIVQEEDPSCASEWNGEVFVDMKMVTVGDYPNLYCFARLNEMDWGRMPVLDNTFLVRMNEQERNLYFADKPMSTTFFEGNEGKIYDLNPFAPDWTQTGWTKFALWVKCADTSSGAFVDLGVVQGDIDLQNTEKATILQNENYRVLIYLNSKTNLDTGTGSTNYLKIAPPFNLTYSRDPNKCQPPGNLLCQEKVGDNYVLLNWDWNPEQCVDGDDTNVACVGDIAGFNIYRVSYPGSELVGTISVQASHWADSYWVAIEYPDEDYTIYETDDDIIKALKTVLGRRAFYVTTYSGDLESERSNIVELEPPEPPEVKTKTFFPSARNVYINGSTSAEDPSFGRPDGQANIGPYQVYTGFTHISDPSANWAQYGLFSFDLSSLEGKKISEAKLSLNETYTNLYMCGSSGLSIPEGCGFNGFPDVFQTSCASMLMVMDRDARGGFYSYPPRATITEAKIHDSMDVTEEVRMWTEGSIPNYGFLLWTEEMYSVNDFEEWGCDSVYGPVELAVEYTD